MMQTFLTAETILPSPGSTKASAMEADGEGEMELLSSSIAAYAHIRGRWENGAWLKYVFESA